jgi:hypothetical protein
MQRLEFNGAVHIYIYIYIYIYTLRWLTVTYLLLANQTVACEVCLRDAKFVAGSSGGESSAAAALTDVQPITTPTPPLRSPAMCNMSPPSRSVAMSQLSNLLCVWQLNTAHSCVSGQWRNQEFFCRRGVWFTPGIF